MYVFGGVDNSSNIESSTRQVRGKYGAGMGVGAGTMRGGCGELWGSVGGEPGEPSGSGLLTGITCNL
ncbi:MAG: hypothetical protein K0Q66_1246 [Chitinophagaceae bacterium]|nr:hypothetical protein [Chitinophagaceae bacterium]